MSSLVIPNTFVSGTLILPVPMNANFSAISNVVNGNLDHTNLSPSAGITVSQLNLTGVWLILGAPNTATWASGEAGDSVPRVTQYTDGAIGWGPGGGTAQDTYIWRSGVNALTLSAADGSGSAGALTIGGLTCTTVTASGNIQGVNVTATGVLSAGANGGTNGSLALKGSTSGTTTLQAAAAAGGTFTLPAAAPTAPSGTGVSGKPMLGSDSSGVLSFNNTPPRYTSPTPAPLVQGTATAFTHLLGAVPSKVWFLFTCISTDATYAVNDNVIVYPQAPDSAGPASIGCFVTNTTVTVVTNTTGNGPTFVNKAGGTSTAINWTKWNVTVFAEL